MKLSLIVPVAPGDPSWQVLLADLVVLEQQNALALADAEVIFVGSDQGTLAALAEQVSYCSAAFRQQLRIEQAGHNRATTMNAGAASAQGDYLWFVHADSRLGVHHINSLLQSIQKHPAALHYFNLRFYGHPMMWLNSLGVWIRSHWLATPFGDQALCLSRQDFVRIGAYPEDVQMGEDHALVWHALQQGMPLKCTGTALLTSARKYEQNGWLKTTGLHVYLWAKQAWPEFKVLLKQRLRT